MWSRCNNSSDVHNAVQSDGTRDAYNHSAQNGDPSPDPAVDTPASDGLQLSVPKGIDLRRRRKLVIHMDLNNTILVSDAVTRQGTVAALDYFISTVTWGKLNKQGKWECISEAPSLLPPCKDAVSYYSQFGRVSGFTATAEGKRFRAVLEEHLALLQWPGEEQDRVLAVRGEDGRLYHWILPSFFQLLQDLVAQGREFTVLFRTFGTDLPRVLLAMNTVLAEGTHPLFPDLPILGLTLNETLGKIRCSKRDVVLTRGLERVSARDSERGLYHYLSSLQGLCGFQDHFDWWARNSYSLQGGKPMWIDPFDPDVQHIFIDDNIRMIDEDTIVHPKVFLEPGGTQTRTASTSELYDISLVQTDLLRAISDHCYFSNCIQICEENYERNLQQADS
ncbi:uncharacterized protein LOC136737541 [Amia ocellicauda]|uniref:uncharacterized protein LOC136737541 n=1 Tax=Amia ocellicauda TaxID=2972642 RepID=UPI003463A62C